QHAPTEEGVQDRAQGDVAIRPARRLHQLAHPLGEQRKEILLGGRGVLRMQPRLLLVELLDMFDSARSAALGMRPGCAEPSRAGGQGEDEVTAVHTAWSRPTRGAFTLPVSFRSR